MTFALTRYPFTRTQLASCILAIVLLAPVSVFCQALAIPGGTSEAAVRAAAEREATSFPATKSQSDSAQPRVCVTGHDLGPARSGEFNIGGNLGGASAMRAGRGGKVWWAPLHAAPDMPALMVRGRNLTNLSDTLRYVTSDVAWTAVPEGPPVPREERHYFFPSGIRIPQPGRWLLVATSGTNWGCFILSVIG